MSETVIAAEGVEKSYFAGKRELPVLRGIDLSVRRGETLLLYGPSGAGKSTLLHILALIDRPTKGRVLLEGRDVTALGARARARLRNTAFGFVFQFYHLLPDFTALENVYIPVMMRYSFFGWRVRGRRARERARELLQTVGLGERMRHRPRELSGGEQQRVALARALVTEPKIVFLDEPTGNLDTRTAGKMMELLSEMKKKFSQTFLMVTHNRALVSYGMRTINIVDGRIVKEPPDGFAAG